MMMLIKIRRKKSLLRRRIQQKNSEEYKFYDAEINPLSSDIIERYKQPNCPYWIYDELILTPIQKLQVRVKTMNKGEWINIIIDDDESDGNNSKTDGRSYR